MRRRRAVIVAPVAVRYDAISMAARHTYLMLRTRPDWDVTFLTTANAFDDLPARVLPDSVFSVLGDPDFCAADLIVYHFGIWSALFDAMLVGNGRAKQVVCFHNITPPDLLDAPGDKPAEAADREKAARSFRQLHNLRYADRLWPVSDFNAEMLVAHGMDRSCIDVIPLAIDQPALTPLSGKPSDPIEVLYVGRAVRSKGLLDGLEAFGRVDDPRLRLTVAGNALYSDSRYVERCRETIRQLGLEGRVAFRGTLSDAELADAYRRAHVLMMPSYHEGFCMPVIEALRAGCVPVGYAAANIPRIANGLGCLVHPGDVAALAQALGRASKAIGRALAGGEDGLPLDRGITGMAQFDALAKAYAEGFTFARVTQATWRAVDALMEEVPAPAPFVSRAIS